MPIQAVARQTARGTASLLVLLGIFVCAAWLAGRSDLLVLIPSSSPMVFNTAAAFVITGCSLLLLNFGHRLSARLLAVSVMLLALLQLAEYLLNVNLGTDQLFVRDLVTVNTLAPGRMAPDTAAAFVASGLAIVSLASTQTISRSAIAAMLGTLAISLGAAAVVSYELNIEAVYAWVWLVRMSLLTALGLVLLGLTIIAEAIHRSGSKSWRELPWVATSTGVGACLVTIIFWHLLRALLKLHADAPTIERVPDAILVLGLCTSALLAGTVARSRDLSRQTMELKSANRTIAAASARISDLYDHAPCGYQSVDADGVIVDINETELDWLGYSREEVIGHKRISDLMTPASIATFRERSPRFKETGVLRDLELQLVRKDGSALDVLVNATAIFDAEGQFMRSRCTVLDMTERRRIESERARAAEQLRQLGETIEDLYDHAPCGYLSLDVEDRIVRINETQLSWLGYSRTELVGRMKLSDLLTAQSRDLFEAHRRQLARHVNIVDADYDILRKDGSLLEASLSMIPILDADGRLVECRATVNDATERRRLDQLLREGERKLHHLLDILQAAVVVHAPDTTIRYANLAAERLLGLSRHQMAGKDAEDAYWQFVREDGTPMPVSEFPVNVVIRSRQPLIDFIVGFRTSVHADPRWMLVNAVPDISGQGVLQQIVVSFIDVSERKKLERELVHRTQTDLLTGLASRPYFLQLAEHEISRVSRHGGSMSLLMLDVDHFKTINDTYGHQAGDAVLTELGRVMHQALRRIDFAGRFGGEEFVVLLPSTDLPHALEAAERLRQTIASTPICVEGQPPLKMTASIGVAAYDPADRDLGALIRRADEAMYACKRSGRNCISASSRPSTARPDQAAGST